MHATEMHVIMLIIVRHLDFPTPSIYQRLDDDLCSVITRYIWNVNTNVTFDGNSKCNYSFCIGLMRTRKSCMTMLRVT